MKFRMPLRHTRVVRVIERSSANRSNARAARGGTRRGSDSPTKVRFPARVIVGVSVLAATGLGVSASAHVGTSPSPVKAGSDATISFHFGHGCDGSPTTQVALKFPPGFTELSGVPVGSWRVDVARQLVRFAGVSSAANKEFSLSVRAKVPATAGRYRVKVVQTCATGEIAWIQTSSGTSASTSESSRPAPVVNVV